MIKFRVYQNNSEKSKMYKKWYARAVVLDTANLNNLATKIERRCTAKAGDVLLVLRELVEVMTEELQQGNKVKIDGFGTFKVALRTKGADAEEEFDAGTHIKDLKLNFQPECRINRNGYRVKTFLDGAKVKKLPAFTAGTVNTENP